MPIEDENMSLEDSILSRHKAEAKQLQAKVQQLKKSVNKDKKKKKEVQDETAAMEAAMLDRHSAELENFRNSSSNEPEGTCKGIESLNIGDDPEAEKDAAQVDCESDERESGSTENRKVTRAEKRRQKKAAVAKERETLIKEGEKANRFSARNVEAERIKKNLRGRALQMHDINPDGNCLFAAIAHQLGAEFSVSELRSKAAQYMRSHADDFLPFVTHPSTGDLLTADQFDEYCTTLEMTPAWGGQPELRALSQVLKKRIEVVQAEGSPILLGEEFVAEKGLLLAYYRHYYDLGEHYNSVVTLHEQSGRA